MLTFLRQSVHRNISFYRRRVRFRLILLVSLVGNRINVNALRPKQAFKNAYLKERKIFVEINLASEDWVASSLSQTGEMHLLVEELHHFFFCYPERYVANIETPSLPCNCGPYDWHSRLWGVRYNICWNL